VTDGRETLSPMQSFLLQGVFAAVVVGACLPTGLTLLFLASRSSSLIHAVEHGELYMAGGNAAVVGCVCLMAARPDRAANAAIASLFVVTLLVGPCYACVAYFAVQGVEHESVSHSVAVGGGAAAAGAGILVALAFVWLGVCNPNNRVRKERVR
jgi:hypothetical protein